MRKIKFKQPVNSATGKELTLDEAEKISAEWIEKLSPYCIEISEAGTVRRKDRDFTNDIDIVLIRDDEKLSGFKEIVDALEHVKGKADGKWCRRKTADGVVLDIRMCDETDWGWNLFRHTGPTAFHLFALEELGDGDKDFKTENDVFDSIGINYIEPNQRGILDEHKEHSKMKNWIENLKAKKQIGEVTAVKKDKVGKVSIRGFIGSDFFSEGVTDKSIAAALKSVGDVDTVEVTINSGGGSVFDAFSIFTQFRRFDAKIVTIIEGLAASAASFISQAGDERFMAGNALIMNHESSGFGFGNKKEIGKLKNLLEKIDSILEDTLVKTSNQTLNEIRKQMANETFFNAEEALEKGFIDEILEDRDVEPHVKPTDKTEKTLEDIYKRHFEDFKKDEHSFDSLFDLVDSAIAPDKFSTDAYRPSGGFDENLSISNLPCVKDGVVNINGLRYLKARMPLTILADDQDSKKREAIETWIRLAENKFDEEKKTGKYQDDKTPFRIVLEVDVAGKAQTFIQKTEDIQMNAVIFNALGVTDESQVLGAIAKLKEAGIAAGVTLSVPTAPVPTPIITPVGTAVPALESERMSKIELQLAQILNQNATLVAENARTHKLKDITMEKMEEVLQFKNGALLTQRRAKIDEMFYTKRKLTPVQYEKAIKDFVEIEPKDVPETESLYNLSLQIYETNPVNDKMEVMKGKNLDGSDVLVGADPVQVYDNALEAILKEKDWDGDTEEGLNKATALLEEKNPEIAVAYNNAVTTNAA